MPNKDEYENAIKRTASGQGSPNDHELARRAAQQAGSMGNDARKALEESAKKSNQPKGLFG